MFRRRPANPYVKTDSAQVFRVRVRTQPHGEEVEVRFTKGAHIAAGEGGTFFFRKPIVSPRHLDRGELVVHFDRAYRVTATEAENLSFIPVSEWPDAGA
ncbi:hypothetical protein [Deinococcus arcticus]|uniref:Uncharacterized protein n=1 Tax=Deinococcus arcticus TaxID=2136176 RepID=A0A2T3W7S7_9DEIO|nr:hypothetical protein [Deinococcus arcticus]PTA67955.1 hypothetical protein C8263_09510 [Deinococcus arcticus]